MIKWLKICQTKKEMENKKAGNLTCKPDFPVLYCNTQVKQVFAAGRPKGAR